MALVGYDSSDDDEEVETLPITEPPKTTEPTSVKTNGEPGEHHATRDKGFILCNAESTIQTQTESEPAAPAPAPAPSEPQQPSLIGPMRPPEGSSSLDFPPLEEAPAGGQVPSLSLPPGSPYSANRALLRDLTLPTVPDMDIPPSPPGSPPLAANKKFEQFLELKKKGVHFNSKIAQSSALKNPSLMDKLLKFAEIDQKGQYATTLGTDLWDPSVFPKSAHKEQLRQSQTDLGQARARTKGGPVDFVAAGRLGSRDATPSTGHAPTASTGKRKTRFDT
ncbi:putative HCNGP-like protein [Seiridium cardinale]|uniref:HCNGP-like protein n=1 Tax=Seiridium cardinale TaxID=138064 RepID=A0ABR2XIQ8_9PEZI